MNYYRKPINKLIDDVKLKMQMGALTLKLSENNGNISSNTSLIDTNKNNISSNTSLIDTNKNNISSNTSLIDTNKNNISSNTSLIDTNKNNISSNTSLIDTNKNNISNNYNFTQINKKKSDNNTTFIDTNRDNIVNNLSKINAIENNNNLKISDEVFNNRYDIINQSFNFNENKHSYQLFEKVIENNMVSGELIIKAVINYKYDNLKNDLNRLTHLYQFYDDKDNLFYSITLDNHDFSTSNFDKNILNVSDNFCFNIDNKDKIKIVLSLTRINEWGTGNIDLQMIDNNYINIIYNQKTDISNKFDKNDKKLKDIDDKISSNNNLISNNFTSILPLKSNYVIDNIWLFNLNSNKDINFKPDIKKILVYENSIDNQFKPNSFIEINESIAYKYDNIKLYYYVLKEKYILLDQNDTILDEFNFNIKSKGFIFNNLHIYDNQYFFKVQSDITTLKLKVYLERISYDNNTEFNVQLNSDYQSNFVCLKYFKYTS